jgi:hypothetical protein
MSDFSLLFSHTSLFCNSVSPVKMVGKAVHSVFVWMKVLNFAVRIIVMTPMMTTQQQQQQQQTTVRFVMFSLPCSKNITASICWPNF